MILTMLLLGQTMAAAPLPAAAAAPPKVATRDKMVCVSEPMVGSRLSNHRVCRTAAEWERDRIEARDDVERTQRLAKLPGQ